MQINRLIREPERKQITGIPTSTWYDLQNRGLAPPGVRISRFSVGWPLSELDAVNRARIAGCSDDQIREIIRELVAVRGNPLDEIIRGRP